MPTDPSTRRAGVVQTDRLDLQPAQSSDAALLVDVDADSEVMRHLTGGAASTLEECAARIISRFLWIARERHSGEFVGWFSLRPSGVGELELGYRLRRAQWGRGLATEGARSIVDHAFSNAEIHRVWAQTMTVNVRSRAVLDRCGFTFVRTFFEAFDQAIDGSEHGDVEYELTHSEWVRRDGWRSVPG